MKIFIYFNDLSTNCCKTPKSSSNIISELQCRLVFKVDLCFILCQGLTMYDENRTVINKRKHEPLIHQTLEISFCNTALEYFSKTISVRILVTKYDILFVMTKMTNSLVN